MRPPGPTVPYAHHHEIHFGIIGLFGLVSGWNRPLLVAGAGVEPAEVRDMSPARTQCSLHELMPRNAAVMARASKPPDTPIAVFYLYG